MEPGVPIQGGEGSIHTQAGITQAGPTKAQEHPDCPTTQPQPLLNGELLTEESRNSDRAEDGDSDDSLTDHLSTNDVARLLPKHKPISAHRKQREDPPSEDSSSSTESLPRALTNGDPPICTPPSASPPPAAPPRCNGRGDREGQGCPGDKKRLPSTTKSQQSFRADPAQIQQVAGDDCCVHCVLACLFCEVASLCSVVSRCLASTPGCELLCCCEDGASGGVACCDEDSCSVLWECGIVEDCCESADCLEICLECCSICFPV